MQIKCYTLKWVKSHCVLKSTPQGEMYYDYQREMVLWESSMAKELCGNTFTVVRVGEKCYEVKETPFLIPKWLVSKKIITTSAKCQHSLNENRTAVDKTLKQIRKLCNGSIELTSKLSTAEVLLNQVLDELEFV